MAEFLPKLREQWGEGAWGAMSAGITIYQIRYTEGGDGTAD